MSVLTYTFTICMILGVCFTHSPLSLAALGIAKSDCLKQNVNIETAAKNIVAAVKAGATDPSAFSKDVSDACTSLNFVKDNCVDTTSANCDGDDASGVKARLDGAIASLNVALKSRNQSAILSNTQLAAIYAFNYFNACKKWAPTRRSLNFSYMGTPTSCHSALDQITDLLPQALKTFTGNGCILSELQAYAEQFMTVYNYQVTGNRCLTGDSSCASKAAAIQTQLDSFIGVLNTSIDTGKLPSNSPAIISAFVNAGWDFYTTCYNDSA